MKTNVQTNPNALAQVFAEGDKLMGVMAEVEANALRENLSPGPRSGIHYPGQPRVSSAPGEFSQSQTDTLRRMVKSGRITLLKHYAGFVPRSRAELLQALAQEYGAPRNNLIGRANGRRTALDSRVRRSMVEAAKRRR